VFRVAQDPNLKRTVIDTLEHIGSPAALEVLRQCLDDPDPEIQIHALDAADRLLGVD
jgi:HEAT repeat protein